MKTYKLKNKDIEITEDELEELIRQRDEKGKWKRWRGKAKDIYYYIEYDEGYVWSYVERFNKTNDYHYESGNYYKKEKEAQQALDRQLAKQRVLDKIREFNQGWKSKFGDHEYYNHALYYDYDDGKVHTDYFCVAQESPREWYLRNRPSDEWLDSIKEDFKLYLGVN